MLDVVEVVGVCCVCWKGECVVSGKYWLTADAIGLGLFNVLVAVLRVKVVGIGIVGGGSLWKDLHAPCGHQLPFLMAQVMSQATAIIWACQGK